MAIRLLPPQLANQIAAGEVVERPASVVKELVENSLDAGATQIDIDIEKGGSKLIRVRDNGSGIAEEELILALSRHATSKITDLSDLEAITSLGFRGEALASISSVSRLTLTSKPAAQDAAWQAMAEGRDMQVQIKPAAHPTGTSIEVLDLFFNTPARRKFLRTDKTEFGHIDELIKRLALSRYDVSWHLTHNGQSVRRLKAANDDLQRQKRVAALCGKAFMEQAAFIENQYGDVRIWGWLLSPQACQAQASCQYSYVNGRMMRDKLLNHAIRQAYGDSLSADQQPAFVLYLELDPRMVDVNVHPAKHEVRFHQSRLIHDFVVTAVADALSQLSLDSIASERKSQIPQVQQPATGYHNQSTVGTSSSSVSVRAVHYGALPAISRAGSYSVERPAAAEIKRELDYWQQSAAANNMQLATAEPKNGAASAEQGTEQSALPVYLLQSNRFMIINMPDTQELVLVDLIPTISAFLISQPQRASALMLPQRIDVPAEVVAVLTEQATLLRDAGFDLLLIDKLVIVRAVPAWLRQSALSQWLPEWLHRLSQRSENVIEMLLSMLLNANGIAADALLHSVPDVLCRPEFWRAVPLQLDNSIALLLGSAADD